MSDNASPEWFSTWFNSRYYHVLYGNRDEAEANDFVSKLHNLLQPFWFSQPVNLLELACGAGRHARMFHQLGYKVTAVDLAPESIAEAQNLGPTTIDYQVMDMRNLKLEQRFNVITNLFTSFGYFSSKNDNAAVLNGVNTHLNPGGVFIIDFMNAAHVIQNLVQDEVVVRENIEFNIQRRVENDTICKRIVFQAEGKTYTFEERVQALHYDDLLELLKKANLNVIQSFGSYQLEPFNPKNSDRVILIAQKV